MSPGSFITVKMQVQDNHSINFLKYWMLKNTALRRMEADIINCKAIQTGGLLWSIIHKHRGHTKINEIDLKKP